ncbi:hypothetical protein CRM22_005028 [Opisthorchis felineus]|uniref:Uncharacterized protein n=1 Tax=Opisthorchis felineus TaxID=147828 RepID=A0A4S2LYV9_OPIFE|nr:hypothetical protein CRM22_005028 [Opisthorchis felineus]
MVPPECFPLRLDYSILSWANKPSRFTSSTAVISLRRMLTLSGFSKYSGVWDPNANYLQFLAGFWLHTQTLSEDSHEDVSSLTMMRMVVDDKCGFAGNVTPQVP